MVQSNSATSKLELCRTAISESSVALHLVKELLRESGEDPQREGLVKTPERFLKAFEFFTQGYQESATNIIRGAMFPSESTDMVVVKGIEFYSLCEHHLLPFFGTCHVAYIPNGRVVGLSKIPRIVDMFARRLQIQEDLTCQIANCLEVELNAIGVAVVMEASHTCMMMRGVEKKGAVTESSCFRGKFQTPDIRVEFLSRISRRY